MSNIDSSSEMKRTRCGRPAVLLGAALRLVALACCTLALTLASGAENLPTKAGPGAFELPDLKVVKEYTSGDRKVIAYEHGNAAPWGYAQPQIDTFNVVLPRKEVKSPPLVVVLHGAGGDADYDLRFITTSPVRDFHDNFYGGDTAYVLCVDCKRNARKEANDSDWWWGSFAMRQNPKAYKDELTPVEKRVLGTVEWAAGKFNIDRNRIYLSGVSMGGSGSLGIGFLRGDVFAAIHVVVPSTVKHMKARTQAKTFVDPPPVVDFSSQLDGSSEGHEEILKYFAENRYALVFGWGRFGHAFPPGEVDAGVFEFPWLDIRRNEAYPVFTQATSNNRYPGFKNGSDPDQVGQINGYFRWKNVEDTEAAFVMELRLAKKEEFKESKQYKVKAAPPRESVVTVTLRRLQKFKVAKGAEYEWSMVREGQVLQSGKGRADAQGLLTLPEVKIADVPANLKITPAGGAKQ